VVRVFWLGWLFSVVGGIGVCGGVALWLVSRRFEAC
jgi:hypothetical protein